MKGFDTPVLDPKRGKSMQNPKFSKKEAMEDLLKMKRTASKRSKVD